MAFEVGGVPSVEPFWFERCVVVWLYKEIRRAGVEEGDAVLLGPSVKAGIVEAGPGTRAAFGGVAARDGTANDGARGFGRGAMS